MRPGRRWAHSVLLRSFGCALAVVRFIAVRLVHLGVPLGSLGSFGCALVVVGFIQGSLVHSDVPCGSLGSFGVVGFIRVHPGRC